MPGLGLSREHNQTQARGLFMLMSQARRIGKYVKNKNNTVKQKYL